MTEFKYIFTFIIRLRFLLFSTVYIIYTSIFLSIFRDMPIQHDLVFLLGIKKIIFILRALEHHT